ncbi:MAG TPA: hypothetical protein VM370_08005 [Candidatus Thermoplasmatota archaeon]|nr:hypothetical protein [Candidatus Thermoplasmatota archaeon]
MPRTRLTPAQLAGLCAVCAGTATMPRSAPAHLRVPCEGCEGTGAVA